MITQVLKKCGVARRVIANDRQLFKTWTESWGLSFELICYAAELAAGTQMPLAYLNRTLSNMMRQGIVTVEQAQQQSKNMRSAAATTASFVGGTQIERRNYTDEEINSWFSALEEDEK